MPKRILITTIGSHGDIHPYVGVGQALRKRGHEVALLANPYFKRVAEDAGLEFVPVGEFLDLKEISQRPYLMGGYSGTKRILLELIIPETTNYFRALEAEFSRRRPDAVLNHHICCGVTWACRKHDVPVAVGCLSPLAWLCPEDPAYLLPIVKKDPSPAAMKRWIWIGRVGTRLIYDGALNKHRRGLGLPKGKGLLNTEFRGGDINLALWSPHFRGSLKPDPEHGHICGFVWFDRHSSQEHAPEEIERFLAEGEPPVIFTLGTTAVHVAGPFYEAAAQACERIGRRGLLLTGHADYAPKRLPSGVKAFTYAPFSVVLPRGCATVHHGGVGTTAQAMKAGRPTVIVPFAHDQFDNAARARRLGVSATVARGKVSVETLAAALTSVLTPEVGERARALGERLRVENGAEAAAARMESLAGA